MNVSRLLLNWSSLFFRMTSEITMKCWLCPETFAKTIELKSHAIDKHDVCRVVCPWCCEKKETFKRMSELSKHAKRKHNNLVEELKEMDFFSETNGFWLAERPQDYAKAVKPSDWPNMTAIRTRAALIRWLEKRGGSKKARQEWEDGWNQALGIRPVHQTPANRKRKTPSYSPSKPELSAELEIASISLTSTEKVAYLKMEETSSQLWYKVEFQTWVVEDKKAMDNLLRRMAVIKDEMDTPKTFSTTLKLKDISFTLSKITSTLGVGERHIKKVLREMKKVEKLSLEDIDKKVQETVDFGEDPEFEIMDTLEEEVEAEDTRVVVSRVVEERIQVVPQVQKEAEGQLEVEVTKEGTKTTCTDTGKENQEEEIAKEKGRKEEVEATSLEETIEKDMVAGKDMVDQPVICDDQVTEELSFDKEVTTETTSELDHQKRAEHLLRVGGMPLFPPARRQWGDWQLILSTTPTNMYWPPKNWTSLSGEDKLTAWRFAAYSLEREHGGNMITKEREVLDKYAMLALPGTKLEKVTDGTHTITTRLGNFSILCKIYKGEMTGDEAEGWLSMLERAVGDTWKQSNLHRIMEDVPLRLTK